MDGGGGDAVCAKKLGKHGRQVCQICGDGVGTTADGELFTTYDTCGFPVCWPCYEYERKDDTSATRGAHQYVGEESEDVDADDFNDFNYPTPGNQDHKHKIAERMFTWRMNSGASDDVGHAKYDNIEIGHPKYKAFAYFDRNQSRYIEIDELCESLASGLGPNHEEVINAIICDVDTDKISFDEFAAMMKAGIDWRKASR